MSRTAGVVLLVLAGVGLLATISWWSDPVSLPSPLIPPAAYAVDAFLAIAGIGLIIGAKWGRPVAAAAFTVVGVGLILGGLWLGSVPMFGMPGGGRLIVAGLPIILGAVLVYVALRLWRGRATT